MSHLSPEILEETEPTYPAETEDIFEDEKEVEDDKDTSDEEVLDKSTEFATPVSVSYEDFETYEVKPTKLDILLDYVPSFNLVLLLVFIFILYIFFKEDLLWISPVYNHILKSN